jgi:hypothetical protein
MEGLKMNPAGKQFFFGAGYLYGVDNQAAVPTPIRFGTLQDVALEFASDTKELWGSEQMPDHIGRGKMKVTGKAKMGQINGALIAKLFFGQPQSTGQILSVQNEPQKVPNSGPSYAIPPNNQATFTQDLGVRYGATGIPFTKVEAPPTEKGQYSVDSTGVYAFSAADAGASVYIDYLYTASNGQTLVINNQQMGLAPTFKMVLAGITDGQYVTMILNRCISAKLSFPTKNEDHMIQEFDFAAQVDDADVLGTLSTSN